jgi:hypothetical protein
MITNSNIRILDYDLQLIRIFERFYINYDDIEEATGIYDVIFLHREGMQDNFENVKQFMNDDTKIIVDITTESGNLQIFLDKFKEITDSLSNQFYLFVDSDLSNYLNNVNVKYKCIHSYELSFYAFLNTSSDSYLKIEKNRKEFKMTNGFMSFNGSIRIQRILFLLELIKNNIDYSKTSFLFYTSTSNGGYQFDKTLYETILSNLLQDNYITESDYIVLKAEKLPKILDYDSTEPIMIENVINNSYDSPLNFVTENVTGLMNGDESEYGLITFSEKTLKPFLAHQLPMIFGLYGLNGVLRDLGFDLFDDFINHTSYENIKNPHQRLKEMCKELKRLLELDILEFRNNNLNRIMKNALLVHTLSNKGFDTLNNFYKTTLL